MAGRKEKYLGKTQMTYEMVAPYMQIEEGMRCIDIYTDPSRRIVTFVFESDEQQRGDVGTTYPVGEGQQIPNFDISFPPVFRNMQKKIDAWNKIYPVGHDFHITPGEVEEDVEVREER